MDLSNSLFTWLPLGLALLSAPVVAVVGLRWPAWAERTGTVLAFLTFGALLITWGADSRDVHTAWAPTWGLWLSFSLDGLAALYALLAAGVGAVVLFYSAGYLPRHVEHEHQPAGERVRFCALMLVFLTSMLGLCMADNLLLMFIFWELTTLASYLLIAFDFHQTEARVAALMALLVTGITSLGFLVAALLLYATYGTFSVPELVAGAQAGQLVNTAGWLFLIAALGKSAQVPFHFWLPRAMAAPTPVSAYLHSAAMVAAGVFLLKRIYPLLELNEQLLHFLPVIGSLSIAVGGVLALTAARVKELLAYSTIAQYGYVLVLLGVGGSHGVVGASFYVLAHALSKCALFLTAGVAVEATGTDQLSESGGLARTRPVLAISSGIAAAALAGLPLTMGFFKDELFFQSALNQGSYFPALAVAAAALTLAYVWRFWSSLFLGTAPSNDRPLPWTLTAPVVVLALILVAGGIVVSPWTRLAEAAGTATWQEPASVELAYHLDARGSNILALIAYGTGLLLIAARALWAWPVQALSRLTAKLGPERWYHGLLAGVDYLSDRMHQIEVRDLAARVATVIIPAAFLLLAGALADPLAHVFRVDQVRWADLPIVLGLALTATTALAATLVRDHLTLVLVQGVVGSLLAVVFAFLGGPDVALVAVLISVVSTLLFIAILVLIPPSALRREEEESPPVQPYSLRREWITGLVLAGGAFLLTWLVLSQPAARETMAEKQLRLAPAAHARDTVTAILTDFRGLDTMGEITVLAVALLGVMALLRWRKS